MSTIVVRRKHDLGLAKAKRLAESVAKQLRADYGGSFSWRGDDLHFQRTGASGSVAVGKDDFQVRVELGFLLGALRSRIEQEIVTFCDANFGAAARTAPSEPSPRASRRRKDRQSS
jgi:putative polyhydroxyalkanoate system protein